MFNADSRFWILACMRHMIPTLGLSHVKMLFNSGVLLA